MTTFYQRLISLNDDLQMVESMESMYVQNLRSITKNVLDKLDKIIENSDRLNGRQARQESK